MVLALRLWKVCLLLFCSTATIAHWAIALRQGIHLTRCQECHRGSMPSLSTTAFCFRQKRGTGSHFGPHWQYDNNYYRESSDEGSNLLLLTGRISTPFEDVKILMESMIVYFESMVDPETLRFFLYSFPHSSQAAVTTQPSMRSHAHCPLRDMGSVWDACKAVKVLRYHYGGEGKTHSKVLLSSNLEDAILETIGYYASSLVVGGSCNSNRILHLSAERLREPPKISHNALLLLGLVGLDDLGILEIINDNDDDDDDDAGQKQSKLVDSVEPLALGILSLQRSDGAFQTQFHNDDNMHSDIAFSPGQAMTALMEVYLHPTPVDRTTIDQIMPSMLRAFEFYRDYYEKGRKENTIDANYSIWQIQAFARLALALENHGGHPSDIPIEIANEVKVYCLDLCKDILHSPAWKLVSRGNSFYPNLSTIEIACGLDALCQGYRVLLGAPSTNTNGEDNPLDEGMKYSFRKHIDAALDFLKWSQDQIPQDALVGYGGLGHGGYWIKEQRLDVTGHAIGAVANLVLPN